MDLNLGLISLLSGKVYYFCWVWSCSCSWSSCWRFWCLFRTSSYSILFKRIYCSWASFDLVY